MRLIDLSHSITADISLFPGTEPPVIRQTSTVAQDGFSEMSIRFTTHTGTHVDAPYHILQHGKTLDEFPPEQFYGPAMVADCTRVNNGSISLADLMPYANILNTLDFVLLNTGWSDKWKSAAYLNDFPTLSIECAQWLSTFSLKGIGVDVISVDKIDSSMLPVHQILLKQNYLIVENLTNLSEMGRGIFTFSCLPLKIEKADASPVRAVGIINNH